MSEIVIENVCKTFQSKDGTVNALKNVNLTIEAGDIYGIIGMSGAGKSTLVRCMNFLEEPTSGQVYIDGQKLTHANKTKIIRESISMVFQQFNLYPHMTVRKNMAFALELSKVPQAEIDQKVNEAAKILGLEPYLDRKPRALSGGQRQRVALGRAMVRDPEVFLLDEPLSNLDAKLRTEMRSQIAALHKRLQTTFVYVTHDQTEAMTMGDRIVVMKDGYIQQVDTPQNLYNYPCNMFVAGFIGSPQMNFLNVKVEKEGDGVVLVYGSSRIPMKHKELLAYVGKEVVMGIRPEDIHVEESYLAVSEAANVNTHVDMTELMGSEIYLYLKANDQKLVARVPAHVNVKAEDDIRVAFDTEKIHVFDKETEKVICQ